MTKVFWTGATKSGCAGQFVNCFVDDGGMQQLDYEKKIMTSESGGSSVGVIFVIDKITVKTLPGETKMYFACQSKTIRSASNVQLIAPVNILIKWFIKFITCQICITKFYLCVLWNIIRMYYVFLFAV